MVSPGSAPLLSCAPGLTQNAPRAARAVVRTGSVTWTAAVKTSTALIPWTPKEKAGESRVSMEMAVFNNRPVSVSVLCPLLTVMLLFVSAVATLLVQHLPPSSLGRSSLRTTVKVRTWSSFPAALVLKRTTKQMDSQTWDPHFPAGQHFSVGNTAVQKKKLLLFCSVFPPVLWVWFKSGVKIREVW